MLAEKQRGHKLKGTFPKEVPIPDLTRPNFGDKDEEIFETQKNILAAEIKHEAILKAEFYKPNPIPDLRLPNFGEVEKDV